MTHCCGKLRIPQNLNMVLELCWQFYIPLMKSSYVEEKLVETIAELRDLNLDICIVSNTFVPGETLDRHLKSEGLLELFPNRIYSCDVGVRKPRRAIFQAACDLMKVEPGEVIFVGINPNTTSKARAKWHDFRSQDPAGKYRRPRYKPSHTVQALTELPKICKSYL